MRKLTGFWKHFITLMSIALVVFQIYTAGFGVFPDIIQRSVHLFFVLAMIFLLKPIKKGVSMNKVPFYDVILSVVCMACCAYLIMIYEEILWDPLQWLGPIDKWAALVLTILILEASRRAVGLTFPIMAVFFIIYAMWGQKFPGVWAHKNFTFNQVFQNLYHTTNGIWGQMVGLSAGMLAMFGIFGAVLGITGGSQTFIKIAQKATGKSVGGPGKVSLIASGLFGMISGSAMANVVATGTFTIPMMKDEGYDSEWSAAISAVGSTGGQIMPPIMGSAAFIMAQLIGEPYMNIAKAAILPAVLYYMGAYVAVHFISKRLGIRGKGVADKLSKTELAIIFVPLAVFVAFLLFSYTVTKAAFYATVVGVLTAAVCYYLENKQGGVVVRRTGKLCLGICTDGASSILSMAGLLAGAQISIALISQSGFGVKLSNMIVSLGQGQIILCLLLAMVVCFILGMGLPPTAAYVLAAAILAPALIKLDIEPLVAHLFVFYFSTIGAITPPVCAAVFLAAGIADSNWLKTGWLSVLLAIPAFLVPFVFAYDQSLMLAGSWGSIAVCTATAAIGVYFMGIAIAGYFKNDINIGLRLLMFVGGALMFVPSSLFQLVGLGICVLSYVLSSVGGKKPAAPAA